MAPSLISSFINKSDTPIYQTQSANKSLKQKGLKGKKFKTSKNPKMSEYQNFSPQSPNPEDNEGVRPLVLEKERKTLYLEELKVRYHKSMRDYELALHRQQLAANKKNSTRSKRKRSCEGCQSKWCEDCGLEKASKMMRVAGDNVSETKAELEVIQSQIDYGRTVDPSRIIVEDGFFQIRPATEDSSSLAVDNNNDDAIKEEVKQENGDVKQENDDGTYATTIGIVNAVKSEPSNDYPTTSDDSSSENSGSDDASSDGSSSDDAVDDDTDSYTDDDNDDIEDSESIQAEYPSTPSQTDDNSDDDTEDEDDTEDGDDTEDENGDELSAFQKILNRL